jgi:glycosyltransferase involved in cell wall biosynthesis
LLHVAQISFFLDPQGRDPEQLLHDWPSLGDVAEAACASGVRISVVQACSQRRRLTRNAVDYHFLTPEKEAPTIVHTCAFRELVRDLAVDVFHVHGLGFPADVLALSNLASHVPILAQDHASRPPRIWQRRLWRRGLSTVSGIAFCASAQAQPFLKAGLVHPQTSIYAIPESTSRFTPGDQAQARRVTGLHGDPGLLWVGHLNENKDPFTVLNGVSEAARQLPGVQLWCCFGVAPLLSDVQARIDTDPLLRGRVHLLGQVPHASIEQLMRAADIFVLGSHREGSGYSLIEALACGLPPVITDIPSFRALTGDGAVGKLWRCGDSRQLCNALLSVASQSRQELRMQARALFDKELSFEALGRKLSAAYRQLLDCKTPAVGFKT